MCDIVQICLPIWNVSDIGTISVRVVFELRLNMKAYINSTWYRISLNWLEFTNIVPSNNNECE